jgi:hypothetical protein
MRPTTALLIAAGLAAALAACGKKANLDPPPGKESLFPRVYPYGAVPSAQGQYSRVGRPPQQPQQPLPETDGEQPPNSLLLPQPALPPPSSP